MRALVAASLLVALAAPARAGGDDALKAEAERRNRKASELYKQGRYDEALKLYQAAYDLHPDTRYLFNIGLAREKIFDYEGCAIAFQRVLDTPTVAANVRTQAEERRKGCFERATIPVRFTSAPTNAGIFIAAGLGEGDARKLMGRTPQELPLAPGSYVVTMELEGYVPRQDAITVAPGERPQVDFVLEKLSSLRIEADPGGARVQIDDGEWQSAPARREVQAGKHDVRVDKDGYQPVSREVRVEPGQEVSLVLSLRPLPRRRTLAIRSPRPTPGARVVVDGRETKGDAVSLELAPGSHHIEATAPGRRRLVEDVSLPEDRDLSLVLELEPHRSRRDRLIVWGLFGGSAAAATLAGVYGILALDAEGAFQDDPTPALQDRGQARAELADLFLGTAVVLAGSALVYHFLTAPGESSVRVDYGGSR